MKLYDLKSILISIGKDTHDEDVFYYEILTLKNSNEEEILEVTIDRKLTFHQHIKKISSIGSFFTRSFLFRKLILSAIFAFRYQDYASNIKRENWERQMSRNAKL